MGGVQRSIISVSDGLSKSKDDGGPGTEKNGWQYLKPSPCFIYFYFLSLVLTSFWSVESEGFRLGSFSFIIKDTYSQCVMGVGLQVYQIHLITVRRHN